MRRRASPLRRGSAGAARLLITPLPLRHEVPQYQDDRVRATWPRLRRKMKRLRRTLLSVGIVTVALVVALAVGEELLKSPLVHFFSGRTGRDIRIDGAFAAHLFALHPTITAEQVTIGNPPWMPPGVTAKIHRLTLILEWHRSIHPLGLRRLEMDDATLYLLRDAMGKSNWSMHADGPGAGPPLIASLAMPNARVELNDARRHLQFQGIVSAGDVNAGGSFPPLRLTGAGQLNGRAVSFVIDGDPLLLVRRDHPYHFAFDERSGGSQLLGRGFIVQPFDFRALRATFSAVGPNMRDAYFLVGLRLPNTGPYRLSGQLTRQGMHFLYSELAATTGASDMSGTLAVDRSSGRTRITGELSSQLLRLADLGARAAGVAPPEPQTPGLRLPDTPFRLSGMARADAVIQFRARTLAVGPAQLRNVAAAVAIDRGVLSIDRFKARFADGTLSGSARLDASQQVPRGALSLSAAGVQLDNLKGAQRDPPFAGQLSGRLQLSGTGNSFHDLAAGATGTIAVVVPHGTMRTSLADAAGLDLIGALGARLSNKSTDVHCAVTNLDAHNGLVTVRTFLIDTDEVLINGTGNLQMDSEQLDLTLRGQPQKARLAMRSAVAIRGTLRHPQIKLVGHTVMAAVLKIVLEPVTAALTFVDPALPRDPDCSALMTQAGVAPGAPAAKRLAD